MSNQVPVAEDQLAALRKKLSGHRLFGKLRGTLGMTTAQRMRQIAVLEKSPKAAVNAWSKFDSDVRPLLDLYAKYLRGGWKIAADELMEALEDEHFIITGEVFPLEKTYPVTLLIPELDVTLVMLRWMIEGCPNRTSVKLERTRMTLNPFFKALLEAGLISEPDESRFVSVGEAFTIHLEHALKPCARTLHRGKHSDWPQCLKLDDSQLPSAIYSEVRRHKRTTLTEVRNVLTGDVAFLFHDQEQSEVLRHLTRSQQRRVSTWQFHLPRLVDKDSFSVGLHPVDEHDAQKAKHPAFTSRGISRGYGARVFSGDNSGLDEYHVFRNGEKDPDALDRFVFENSPSKVSMSFY